jgi:hypothetical protein
MYHAHILYRMVFAAEPDSEVEGLRPRDINPDLLCQEAEVWRNWHPEQTAAELDFMNRKDENTATQLARQSRAISAPSSPALPGDIDRSPPCC